jgi:hypothetical protein
MKYITLIREVLCQALLASHLTRRGRWQSAVKLMGK